VAASQQPAGKTAAAAETDAHSSTDHQQQQGAQAQNGSSTEVNAAAADWAAEAQKYDTVEAWFHSLIRSHFKGSLKV
jgi:hypothetical protein